jgi:GH15 family glucan-1,4-alpha-glucosidase
MTTRVWHETPQPWRLSEYRDYRPISSYAVIGDLHTAALVGLNGSIDWCCLPHFDSPSVFASMLDSTRGGSFHIAPAVSHTSEQRYSPATNVLITTFSLDAGGVVELTDFMPITTSGHRGDFPEIHRGVRCTRGEAEVVVRFAPRFDYGASMIRLLPRWHGVLATDAQDDVLTLAGPRDIWWRFEGGVAIAAIKLREGEQAWFVARYDDDEVRPIDQYQSEAKLKDTIAFWDAWTARIQYSGRYRSVVERSALALKLMCFQPTGAIVAAPTTSLPEQIGGLRNWDYRYAWLRDSAFVLYSLNILGHIEEADRFMRFLKRVCRKTDDTHLQIMYGIDGRRHLTERVLDHLDGYRGSKPVRVGNGAYDQLQLDVYGEVLETAYLWSRRHEVTEGTWLTLQRLVDWVADNWRRPDSGIWEVRAGLQHYVFSKVMCWVALDRGIRLARRFRLPADLTRWQAERATVHAEVMEKGWSEKKQSFVQYYGTEALDASNLVIPMVNFLPSDHPRVRGTVMATLRELTSEDQELVYRYRNDDGLPGEEGVFSICTFWLAEALALCGEVERGERIFQRMLKHANHVGLYSEELNPATGEFLGNHPQAFTHIALINCAHVLERMKRRRTLAT